MNSLLRSDFRRMCRSKLLYLGMIAVVMFMAYALVNNIYYMSFMPSLKLPLDNLIFAGTSVIKFSMAVFTCFFVGTDYSDGTIRNKIMGGHSRFSIYMSYFVTTTMASLIMILIGSLVILAIGSIWMGGFTANPAIIVPQVLCCILSIVSLNALILLIAVLVPSRAISVTVCLLLAIMLGTTSTTLLNKLMEEPTIPAFTYYDEEGILQVVPERENPRYVSGTERIIVQTCYDAIPTSQMNQYGYDELPENILLFPIYSLAFISIYSTTGLLFFKRKDLK